MLEELQQRIQEVETRMREFERMGARLNEVQRMVATEADTLLRLKEQLAAILKREHWNAMVGSQAGRAPTGRTGSGMSPAAMNQVNAAVQATLRQAADVQAKATALLRQLAPAPAPVAPPPVVGSVPFSGISEKGADPLGISKGAAPVSQRHETGTAPTSSPPAPVQPQTMMAHPAPAVGADPFGLSKGAAPISQRSEMGTAPSPALHEVAAPHPELMDIEAAPTSGPLPEGADESIALEGAIAAGRESLVSLDRAAEAARQAAGRAPDETRQRTLREAAEKLQHFTLQVEALGRPMDVGHLIAAANQLAGGSDAGLAGESGLASTREIYLDVRNLCARLQREAATVRARQAARDRRHHKVVAGS
jgi:hypothetical protein